VGYIILILIALVIIPVVFAFMSRRSGKNSEGQVPIGKPVMVAEPAADEPTPAASSTRKDTTEAQRRTPAA
jgi:hypothetical protein